VEQIFVKQVNMVNDRSLTLALLAFAPVIFPSSAWAAGNATKNRVAEIAKILGVSDGEPAAAAAQTPTATAQVNIRQDAQNSLEKLTQIATAENRSVAIAEATKAESAAARIVARGKFQPGVQLFAGQSQTNRKIFDPDVSGASDTRDYGVRLRYNLFNDGADWSEAKAAHLSFVTTDTKTEAARQQVALSARRAIIEYNQAAMELLLAEAAAANATEILTMSLRKLNAGLVGKIDLHKTEVRESEAAAQVEEAKLTLQRSKLNLLQACGIDQENAASIEELIVPLGRASLPLPSPDDIKKRLTTPPPQETLAEKSATYQQEISALETTAAYRKRWIPAVDLTAALTRDQTDTRGDLMTGREPTTKSLNQVVGVELNWKLWSPSDDGSIAASIAARDKASLTAADIRNNARVYRADLKTRLNSLLDMQTLLRQTWERASRLYEAHADLYQAGAVDIFEVINSETQRLSALKSWYQTRNAMHLALLQWEALEHGLVETSR